MGKVIQFKPRPREPVAPIEPDDGYMPPADLDRYWREIETGCLDIERRLRKLKD